MKKINFLFPVSFLVLFFSACSPSAPQTFHGYVCKDDCSEHESGYRWGEKNKVIKDEDCLSFSQSFEQGCTAFVKVNTEALQTSEDLEDLEGLGNDLGILPEKKSEYLVTVKYREKNPVDVSSPYFESVSPQQPTVKNLYYDLQNNYLIINLRGVHYHYCFVPENVWETIKISGKNIDEFYTTTIKGNYSCKNKKVPEY